MNQGKTYTVTNEDRFLPLGVLFIDDDVDVMAVKTPVYYLRDPQAGQVVRTAQDKKVSTDATLSEAGVTYTYVGDKQFRLKERVEVQDTDGNYLFTGVVVASAGGTTVTLKPVENVEHTAGDIVITEADASIPANSSIVFGTQSMAFRTASANTSPNLVVTPFDSHVKKN